MLFTNKTRCAAILALLFGAPAAMAEVSANLSVQMDQTRVVKGRTIVERVPVKSAKPDDQIFYVLTLANSDATPANAVRMVIPVDGALRVDPTYTGGNLGGAIAVSVDGGSTFGALSALSVTKNGRSRSATADDVSHLAVSVKRIGAGAKGTFEYRATVK